MNVKAPLLLALGCGLVLLAGEFSLSPDLRRAQTYQEQHGGDQCQGEWISRADLKEDACFTWPPSVVEAREKTIEQRRTRARERGLIKLVLFYAGFVLIFLFAPPILIYLLLVGIITLYKNIKIVR